MRVVERERDEDEIWMEDARRGKNFDGGRRGENEGRGERREKSLSVYFHNN